MRPAVERAKLALLVFLAAVLQVTTFNSVELLGGTFDVLLVTLVVIALARGAVAGAALGFFGGLVVDTATLGTLGVSSLLLTLVGYWIGRYGETTGRGRAQALFASVAAATIAYGAAGLGLHAVLGEEVSVRRVLLEWLPPTVVLSLVIAAPLRALVNRVLRPQPASALTINPIG
jgi:rod shape-determining protein MreD